MPGPDERHGQPGSPALVTRSAGINQTVASDRLLDSLLRRLPVVVGVGPVGAGELASSNHLITYTVDVVEQVVLETNHTSNHVNEVQEDLDLGVAASRVLLLNDAANPCNVSSSVDPAEALAANGLFRGVEIVRLRTGRRAGPPSASACMRGNVSDEPRAPRRRVDAVELSGSASESVELRFCFPPRPRLHQSRRDEGRCRRLCRFHRVRHHYQQRHGSLYSPRRRPRPQ